MRRAWPVIPFLCVAIARAGAQSQVSGDVGAAHVQQAGIPQSAALTAGTAFEALSPRAWLRSSALVAIADGDRVTAQAFVLGSLLGASGHPARWELAGALSAFAETNDPSTTSGEAIARVRFDGPARGGAIGIGGGATAHGGRANGLFQAQGDAYYLAGDQRWSASLSGLRIPSMITQQFVSGSFGTTTSLRGVSYADGTVGWRREGAVISLGAIGGLRAGFKGVESTGGWAATDAAFWFSPRAALVLAVGRSLDDAVRGVPQTTYANVALRFTARPHQPQARRDEIPGARLIVAASGGGRQRLEVRGVDATRLEVMGDFTDWQSVDFGRDGAVWKLDRPLSSGLHRLLLRIDGGPWIAPANLPRGSDQLGGIVGLITIP